MKLKLEDVRVDSFATADAGTEERGTVHAQGSALIVLTCRASCPGNYTCPECPA